MLRTQARVSILSTKRNEGSERFSLPIWDARQLDFWEPKAISGSGMRCIVEDRSSERQRSSHASQG